MFKLSLYYFGPYISTRAKWWPFARQGLSVFLSSLLPVSETQATSGIYLGPGLMLGSLTPPLINLEGCSEAVHPPCFCPSFGLRQSTQSRGWKFWQSNGSFIHISEVALHVFPWCLGSGMKPFCICHHMQNIKELEHVY